MSTGRAAGVWMVPDGAFVQSVRFSPFSSDLFVAGDAPTPHPNLTLTLTLTLTVTAGDELARAVRAAG